MFEGPKIKINWGKFLDQIKAHVPVDRGDLRDSWNIASQTDTSAVLESELPYARIQDKGGTIPPVDGKLMVFEMDGETIFTRHRKGFKLKGNNYIQEAFDAFMAGGIE